MDIWVYISVLVMCILLEAFFAGSEIAVVSIDRIRLKHMLRKRSAGAQLLSKTLKNPEWLLSTTLVGTNLCVVISNTVATFLIIRLLGESYTYLTLFILYPFLVIFAEILPKTIFQQRSSYLAPKVVYPLRIASFAFAPVVYITSLVSGFMSYFVGKEEKERDLYVTKDELELLLKMSDAKIGGMKTVQKRMIHRIFDFKDTSVSEIMIPGVNVKAVDIDEPLDEVIAKLKEWKHSRVPVYKERCDNVVGIVTAFDFITPLKRKNLRSYVRQIKYFPLNSPIDEIMIKMQHDGLGMAAVVNEYGAVVGVVTLEDIIEEVVGEIEDEHDFSPKLFMEVADGEYVVNAKMTIDSLRDKLKIVLPYGSYETLGGFILDRMKKIPKTGEICKYKNIRFEVLKRTDRTVEEVRLVLDLK